MLNSIRKVALYVFMFYISRFITKERTYVTWHGEFFGQFSLIIDWLCDEKYAAVVAGKRVHSGHCRFARSSMTNSARDPEKNRGYILAFV